MKFAQRKQALRRFRAEQQARDRFNASLEGRIAAHACGVEFRLRGFFPSHAKTYEIAHEIVAGHCNRLERLKDDCVVALAELFKATEEARESGIPVERSRVQKAFARG